MNLIISEKDYLKELKGDLDKIFPPINYKFQRRARKNYICEKCKTEIHKNEYYYEYKSNPSYDKLLSKRVYFKWRKRCINCEPRSHLELEIIMEE